MEVAGHFRVIKIGIAFIFRLHHRTIQLVVFVSSLLRNPRQVLLGVEVSSVTRPAQDVVKATKSLQKSLKLIEGDDGET